MARLSVLFLLLGIICLPSTCINTASSQGFQMKNIAKNDTKYQILIFSMTFSAIAIVVSSVRVWIRAAQECRIKFLILSLLGLTWLLSWLSIVWLNGFQTENMAKYQTDSAISTYNITISFIGIFVSAIAVWIAGQESYPKFLILPAAGIMVFNFLSLSAVYGNIEKKEVGGILLMFIFQTIFGLCGLCIILKIVKENWFGQRIHQD